MLTLAWNLSGEALLVDIDVIVSQLHRSLLRKRVVIESLLSLVPREMRKEMDSSSLFS